MITHCYPGEEGVNLTLIDLRAACNLEYGKDIMITKHTNYLDGGTLMVEFSDGFVAYQDRRLGSNTTGQWFFEYPTSDQRPMKALSGKYLLLVTDAGLLK